MDRRAKLLIATLAALSPLLGGCMPDTPRTVFAWDVNDAPPRQTAQAGAPRPVNGAQTPQAKTAPSAKPHDTVTTTDLPPISYGGGNLAFIWPVSGPVISPYGVAANGARNDGINIAAARGTPIHASAAGTVTYAGDELKDYGNLVLIKHANGYVTAYAHADSLTVSKGAIVTKGEVIGYAGKTGDVSTPQLHFEIRHDTQPVDPRNLLIARNS
jgi:murein DD-endopeptidase MepM/ murein hydrolase activator NlpD